MTSRKAWIAGLLGVAALASARRAEAQIGGLPAAGAASPAAGASALGAAPSALGAAPSVLGAAPAAAGAAQPTTLWGFLGLSKTNLASCKAKICASQIGQLLNSMTVPASGFTGGIIPLLCPPVPSAAQLAAMQAGGGAAGAQAVAAKIMQDEAAAKARVAAVEYLGTVDCRYWKEARDALINALRSDRNECVRYAAARALGSGCCCSKEIIEKLRIVVSGEEDKDPAEASPRVRAAAFAALQNCLAKVPEVIPVEDKPKLEIEGGPSPLPDIRPIRPERSTMAAADPANVAVGYLTNNRGSELSPADLAMERKTFGQTVDDARRTMFDLSKTPHPVVVLPPGKQSVFHALVKARQDVDVVARRKAAAQGTRPPAPMQAPEGDRHAGGSMVDPAVNPTSYVVPSNPSRVSPLAEPPAASRAADPSQSSMSKRGLLGYFVKPKAPAASSEE